MKLSDEDLERLYAENSQDLLRYLARRVFDAQDAMDLMSETFAQALASRNRFKGESLAEGRPWLFGIAGKLVHKYYRRGGVERTAAEKLRLERVELTSDDIAAIEKLGDLATVRRAVAGALKHLPADQQEAIQLRVVCEVPYCEAAKELGVSEDVVRQRVSRGLKHLRDHITRMGEEQTEAYG